MSESLSVNVVVKTGWILERCARELVDRVPDVRMNEASWPPTALSTTDVTYFMPEKDIGHMPAPVQGLTVGLFTHDLDRMRRHFECFDACVAMNRKVGEYLKKLGARNVRVIRPGTPPPDRPIRFGVCGRVYGKGRKGARLVQEAVAAGYSFQACSQSLTHLGRGRPPCRITHPIERRAEFYREIDYLVVTSTEEGGPMPVVEALAHGVPVIAPDVGWCWEYPVIRYERGSWDSLRGVLEGLTRPPTWESWAAGHRALFETLRGQRQAAGV